VFVEDELIQGSFGTRWYQMTVGISYHVVMTKRVAQEKKW
jgi:hypothetical protein